MRLALIFALFSTPASAWEFSATPVCTIWHTTPAAEIAVTYDPRAPKPYALRITLATGEWPEQSPFQVRFDGPNRFTIATDRHRLAEKRSSVIAEDTGFDNVLLGLELNLVATAVLGDRAIAIPLAEAPSAVAKFRDCGTMGLS